MGYIFDIEIFIKEYLITEAHFVFVFFIYFGGFSYILKFSVHADCSVEKRRQDFCCIFFTRSILKLACNLISL